MSEEWWYSVDDQKKGPVTKAALQVLLRNHNVYTHTLVWSHGLAEWTPIGEIDELRDIVQLVPPALPPRTTRQKLIELQSAGPWRRFFARQIDILILSLVLGYFVSLALSYYFPGFQIWIQKPGSEIAYGWYLLPLVLMGEGLIFAVFGNTLGKAALGLVVTTVEATPVSARQYFGRLPSVWWRGLGTGFPFVSLFTMISQYRSVKTRGHTGYDGGRFNVKARKLGVFRGTMVALMLACLWGIVALFNMDAQRQDRKVYSGFVWHNPTTGVAVSVPEGWVHNSQQNDLGQQISVFVSVRHDAVLIFARENAANLSQEQYVSMWIDAVRGEMSFTYPPQRTKVGAVEALTMRGSMVQHSKQGVQATIRKQGSNAWRAVIVLSDRQPVPVPVLSLQELLFGSVR